MTDTVPVPQHEVIVRRALRLQILWQRLPLAPGREHIEDGVENLTDIDVTRSTAALGRWDHGRKHRPLRVGQITGITKALGCHRRSRPEQPDQRRPDKAASFLHRTERLRDSASIVSPIEFTTGTGRCSS
jgi:hypothetical protein